MYWGYRYEEKDGPYHQGDLLETVEAIHEYVQINKRNYPEIRITDETGLDLLVHVIDGLVEHPRLWGLLDVKIEYLDNAHIFNPTQFAEKIRLLGFECPVYPRSRIEAERILLQCYEFLPQNN